MKPTNKNTKKKHQKTSQNNHRWLPLSNSRPYTHPFLRPKPFWDSWLQWKFCNGFTVGLPDQYVLSTDARYQIVNFCLIIGPHQFYRKEKNKQVEIEIVWNCMKLFCPCWYHRYLFLGSKYTTYTIHCPFIGDASVYSAASDAARTRDW